jgi:6-pyruvoyl-tetrahydropterin synthase
MTPNDVRYAAHDPSAVVMYAKELVLHSVHFNGSRTYDNWRNAQMEYENRQYQSAADLLREVLADVHGHRFIITIKAWAELGDGDWAIDDVLMTKLVMEWEHKTLSILPEFDDNRIRSTTEQIARVLHAKLAKNFPDALYFEITVQETGDVYAVYPAPLHP